MILNKKIVTIHMGGISFILFKSGNIWNEINRLSLANRCRTYKLQLFMILVYVIPFLKFPFYWHVDSSENTCSWSCSYVMYTWFSYSRKWMADICMTTWVLSHSVTFPFQTSFLSRRAGHVYTVANTWCQDGFSVIHSYTLHHFTDPWKSLRAHSDTGVDVWNFHQWKPKSLPTIHIRTDISGDINNETQSPGKPNKSKNAAHGSWDYTYLCPRFSGYK